MEEPIEPTLHRLLDAELAYSPVIQEVFSDHLAMMLVALRRLGADDGRVMDVFERASASESEPRDDVARLDARLVEIERDGIDAVVARRIPNVVEGPGTALFHPMIRLSYALEVGHAGQVAAALLDWETRLEAPAGAEPATGASQPTVEDVARSAIEIHSAVDSFITLHMVTGARALGVVAARLEPGMAERLAASTAGAVADAHRRIGSPPILDPEALDGLRRAPLPAADEIAAAAIDDDDPHVVKLADVALAEEARTGDRLYRLAAARVTGTLGPGGEPGA